MPRIRPAELPMPAAELAAIQRRLDSLGLFTAHAYTDVTRLLAEVHRLRAELAARHGEQGSQVGTQPA